MQIVWQVEKQVAREQGGLPKGALWALRGNKESRSEHQRQLREEICKEHAVLARVLSLRDFLADLWNYADESDAREHFQAVPSWCSRSRLKPLIELGRSLKRHTEGILGYFNHYTTSDAIEAINGKLQLAKRRARGYRNFTNFRAIAYWIAGGLEISGAPAPTH